MTKLVGLDDIRAARELLAGVVRTTPLEPSRPLSGALGGPVWLKCENLQRAGSYKVRGAFVRISRLSAAERAEGVVAASAGNHAQGVALAAGLVGTHATVFMPVNAPLPKVAATKGYGAQVELVGNTVDESLVAAQTYAERTGATLIHPFDHRDVVAGQGTVALEILEQCPQVRTIVAGVGGGGLVSGIAVAAKALRPDVRVVGVQAATAAAFPPSLAAGEPVRLPSFGTIADGIAVGRPGELTFRHVRALVDEVVTVREEDISRALLMLLERGKQVVEPAGAVGVAALLSGAVDVEAPVVAVLSGGNIDPLLMLRVIENGLAAAGRYLRVTVRCSDRPGQLASLLSEIAAQGANVVDVGHQRANPHLRLGEVEVALSVETRGTEHSDRLIGVLRASGYQVVFAGEG
ncbi:threonine ammonia-lyase [Salinispora arenicola]|uniref:threonine ammonia-lyase n=1 Tax=Salinispora arenicola TaxID=168697 RepID=A0A542XHQ2_SALAC|nr:threonine ammonia-lyase [Salinispora arenicola]MCN0151587.1 threonine ammonia-lyase [Salinispora arenicola]TQL35365.1 threonine dehydratase [Salinispora arenicola]GIM84821.1 threonine ammonia-lyase [Salinispora arenicola]